MTRNYKATLNLTLFGYGPVGQNEIVALDDEVVADPRNAGVLGVYLLPQRADGSFLDPTPAPAGCCGMR